MQARVRLMGLNARPLTRGAAQVMQRLETCVIGEDANHAPDGTADDETERQQTVKDREQELAEMGGAATPADEAILLQEEKQTAARLCKDEVRLAALVKRRQRVALMVRRQQAAPSERGGLPGGRWLRYQNAQRLDSGRLAQVILDRANHKWLNRERNPERQGQAFHAADDTSVRGKGHTVLQDATAIMGHLGDCDSVLIQRYYRKVNGYDWEYGRAHARVIGADGSGQGGGHVPSVAQMPREIRAILLEFYQLDVDMANAHIAITVDLLLRYDVLAEESAAYATLLEAADPDRREDFLKRVCQHYGLTSTDGRTQAKEVVLRFLRVACRRPQQYQPRVQ